ncbi:cation diffusion facilitator family transporter [Gammaproteobacteria bacterium]|nr:cation diffusion facilitator family transporter [Gammaproteobacteria bacterium]
MVKHTLASHKKKAVRVTLIGSLLDLILGILKIIVGMLSNSFALIADGIHSLSDLLTDAFVLVITRYSNEEADAEHPYGHGRFDTLGALVLGTMLFCIAGIIVYDSIRRMGADAGLPIPGWLALVVAAASIAGKEWIYRYTKKVADEINSSLLLANAWHSRTDAFSSIAVFVGIIGAMLGYPAMDMLAALFVAFMIGKIAWSLVGTNLKELVDTALPEEELADISQHIEAMDGILGAHELRSRLHGGQAFLDIHVQVDSDISVSEGHFIADKLNASLIENFSQISDVVVHIDPELDDHSMKNIDLPARDEVTTALLQCWQDLLDKKQIDKINLHYLDNKIQVEIFLEHSLMKKQFIKQLHDSIKDLSWLSEFRVYGTF